ncbi:DUF1295 domain-containing protein [Aestuariibacter salexigens]|uniref:DUF1295 domain-containing protein n=1 Tax=Aestuariibacter salexigens TaxID=226010 RepID=UPI00040033E0|nr:DUF1295 domain-containing protein [Aestuariibacter salexigens]
MSDTHKRSLIILTVAMCIAALIALSGSYASLDFFGYPLFLVVALLAFVIQWMAFIPAYLLQTEKFYDLTGSLAYLSVVGLAIFAVDKPGPLSILLATIIAIWALRLGSFLFIRILEDGTDSRFDDIKPDTLRFFSTWTLQGLWVVVTAGAALAVITSSEQTGIGIVTCIGLVMWVTGMLFEVVADQQKRRFRANPDNRGKFIHTGLWARSRHPNYFGEILLWLGVAVMTAPALQSWQLGTLFSPVFVYLLLTKLSGVPMLEAKADKAWGSDEAYLRYKATTPVLIPRISSSDKFSD